MASWTHNDSKQGRKKGRKNALKIQSKGEGEVHSSFKVGGETQTGTQESRAKRDASSEGNQIHLFLIRSTFLSHSSLSSFPASPLPFSTPSKT